MSDDTIIVAAEGLANADLDGEAILLDVNTGHYYGLNEVGAMIMGLIMEPTSVAAIKDAVRMKYEVGAEQVEHDVIVFLQAMEARHLIRVIDGEAA